MTMPHDHLFVISGCSSSGKSTLLTALAARGERVVLEPGRRIVKEQLRVGGDALPWADRQRFIDLCAATAIEDYERCASEGGRTFFDRSFIDAASAVRLTGLRAPAHLTHALESKRYATIVFMSPPWEALFGADPERRHSFAESVAEYEVLVPTYREFGYRPVFLPQAPVPDRVDFVLASVAAWQEETNPRRGP